MMSQHAVRAAVTATGLFTLAVVLSAQQPPTPAQSMRAHFIAVNQRIVEMARDFPEAKYSYRPSPDVRSFADVLVHVFSGNVYAAKVARGEKAAWEELDAKRYRTKDEVVVALERSIVEATAHMNSLPDSRFAESLEPWLGVLEHSAEHYGQLVVYYRLNGLVPPASRPK